MLAGNSRWGCGRLGWGAVRSLAVQQGTSPGSGRAHPRARLRRQPRPTRTLAVQVPSIQSSIAPLLDIKKDLLTVPKLAAGLTALQNNCTTCSALQALQPLVGIKDALLQVWAGGKV